MQYEPSKVKITSFSAPIVFSSEYNVLYSLEIKRLRYEDNN